MTLCFDVRYQRSFIRSVQTLDLEIFRGPVLTLNDVPMAKVLLLMRR